MTSYPNAAAVSNIAITIAIAAVTDATAIIVGIAAIVDTVPTTIANPTTANH